MSTRDVVLSALLCNASYDNEEIRSIAERQSLSKPKVMETDSGTVCYLIDQVDYGRTHVIFRGSGTKKDFLTTNFNVKKTEGRLLGSVHSGFEKRVSEVWRFVVDNSLEYARFHGHSLGGAEAVVCGMVVNGSKNKYGMVKTTAITTFGQPRVFGPKGVSNFMTSGLQHGYTRIVNHGDPLPHLPGVIMRYLHPESTEVFFNKKGLERSKIPTLNGFGSLLSIGSVDIGSHSMAEYLKNVHAASYGGSYSYSSL
jgi:hypothetical protein